MTDFLDGELGEFDWGPTTRRRGLTTKVQTLTNAATVHTAMVCVGALVLVLGLTTAWASYQPSDASPPGTEPPAFLEWPPTSGVDTHGVDAHNADGRRVDVDPVQNGGVDTLLGIAGSGPEADP